MRLSVSVTAHMSDGSVQDEHRRLGPGTWCGGRTRPLLCGNNPPDSEAKRVCTDSQPPISGPFTVFLRKGTLMWGAGGQGCMRRAVHCRRRGGTPPGPPPPPPLPMFEAASQNFPSAPPAPRGFKLKNFRPAFGGDHRGVQGGGVSQPTPPPPLPPPF